MTSYTIFVVILSAMRALLCFDAVGCVTGWHLAWKQPCSNYS